MAQQRRNSPAARTAARQATQTGKRRAARQAIQVRKRRAVGRKAAPNKTSAAMAARVEQLRKELTGAFKNRALLYFHFFDELRKELGPERAREIMARAIYHRGLAIGKQFARYAPADMTGIRDAFLKFIPDQGALFAPEVERCDAGGVDIKFYRCPLKEAWQEAGLLESDIATLCHIAGRVDNGTFEGAGFAFSADTWQPGREGCCHLHIRPGAVG